MLNKKKLFKSLFLNNKIDSAAIFQSFGSSSKSNVFNSVLGLQDFYICAYSSILIDYNIFESCRKVATRILKRQKPKGFFFPCFRFFLPYTRKSKNARMGKGKGGFSKFAHRLNTFSPLFFLHKVSLIFAARILTQIEYKLPIHLCLFSVKTYKSTHFFPFKDEGPTQLNSFVFSEFDAIRFLD